MRPLFGDGSWAAISHRLRVECRYRRTVGDHGARRNTHIPFADLNNVDVADLLSAFLHAHGLAKYAH
jgi:hypothetical protein